MENNRFSGENAIGGQEEPIPSGQKEPRQLMKAGFLMLTSAVLGGVAFAIWNKRQIGSMKETSESIESRPVHIVDDDAIY